MRETKITDAPAPLPTRLRVIDSHTIGEPTRVVIDPAFVAGLDLGNGTVRSRRDAFRSRYDFLRRALVGDPRGADAMVGVVLVPPSDPANHGKAFVLCPDGSFDRSPCGTGTSALAFYLHENGLLAEDAIWRQESVLGGVYEASVRRRDGATVPTVKGGAWITAESVLRFEIGDPYRSGLHVARPLAMPTE